jgi:hypothetical protein
VGIDGATQFVAVDDTEGVRHAIDLAECIVTAPLDAPVGQRAIGSHVRRSP